MAVSNTHGQVLARRRVELRAPLPFKGESFPDYVAHRTPPSRLAKSAEPQGITPQHPMPLLDDGSTPQAPNATTAPSPALPIAAGSSKYSPLAAPKAQTTTSPSMRNARTPKRPSLADQLKAISQGVQDVTTRLKTAYQLAGGGGSESTLVTRTSTTSSPSAIEFQATTISMTVGRLDCRFPCPVTFALDHCAYLFQHPFEAKEIHMVMYYRDMTDVSVSPRDKTFRFRVTRALHQFGDDYSPSNPQHWIKIVFATSSDADRVRKFLVQRRRSFTCGGF